MATTTKTIPTTVGSWALPIAAAILVAGSLMFWTCLGLVWLASRPATQQPIVIWMPTAASSDIVQQANHFQPRPANAPQDR